uniref:Uncharacterized protein n=1 Tax=Meloidogyne enterolobii TaxID=390850 RepID=A0A6V7XW05_MELEN|nr:unnamed protein product [Meloidogyne enterolobii]
MKSKSIYNIALAVTILLLLMLGEKVNNVNADGGEENKVLQAEQNGRKVGLADHILKKDKVTLAKGSEPATTQEDYEKYKKLFPDACDVELGEDAKKGEDGYIIVSYSKNSKAAQKGCTLDLYTNLKNEIEFEVFLKNDNGGGPEVCVKEKDSNYNDNVLPFAYSHPAILEELIDNGPILGKSGKGCNSEICVEETCVQKTGLELRWKRFKNVTIDDVNLLLNPIGSPAFKEAKENMKKFNEEPPVYPTVKVERTEYSVQFKTKDPETKYKEYNCTQNPVGNVLTPTTWEIDGAMPNQKKKHLLVFHLLPQKASRQIQWRSLCLEMRLNHLAIISGIRE